MKSTNARLSPDLGACAVPWICARCCGPNCGLLAKSATADGARLAGLMDAAVNESLGLMFPVTVQHARTDIAVPRELPDAMARAIRAALAEHDGDVLAFLPGMAEIRRTQTALDRCGADVLPLHGELPPAEQDRALRQSAGYGAPDRAGDLDRGDIPDRTWRTDRDRRRLAARAPAGSVDWPDLRSRARDRPRVPRRRRTAAGRSAARRPASPSGSGRQRNIAALRPRPAGNSGGGTIRPRAGLRCLGARRRAS